jgi:hypothetical protein
VRAKNVEEAVIRVALPYRDESDFLQREFELLGRWGSFLPGIERESGAVVLFELTSARGAPLLRGEGRVLGHVSGRRGDRGAVIRFTRLERASQQLVEEATRLLAARASQSTPPPAGEYPMTPQRGAESMLENNGDDGDRGNRAEPARAGGRAPNAPVANGASRNASAATGRASESPKPGEAARPASERSREELLKTLRHRSGATGPRLVDPTAPAGRAVEAKPASNDSTQPASQEERMQESKRNGLYLVAGSKGGVGKSMVTMALVDLLREQGRNVFLVECDNSNPDVWKAHKDEVRSELVNLDEAEGWIRLLNICDSNREHVIVVNTAARNNVAVTRFGSTLNDSLDELKRELVTFWVINRQRDSLELLGDFMNAIPRSVLHVVRNGYFGDEGKFELYNSSSTRQQIESKGGQSITFAELADRVADDLYSKHLSIGTATRTLPLGNRAELSRWRGEVKKGFGLLLNAQ